MHVIRFHIRCIFFMASLMLSYSRHVSIDANDINNVVSNDEKCGRVCLTPGCVKTAARVVSALDESADPCENFYKFACGGWLSNNDIPEGRYRWGLFYEVDDDVERKLKALIERELDGTEPPFVKMLKDFYDACTDLETIDKLGSEPLKQDLASLGGWPVVEGDRWNEANFDWVDTLIAFRRLGYNFDMFFSTYVTTDERNKTTNIIHLSRPYFKFDQETFIRRGLNDSETILHYKMAVKEALLLGADENTAEDEIIEALLFQIELAKISKGEEEKKDDDGISTEFTPIEHNSIILRKEEQDEILNITRKRRERRDASGMYIRYTVAELQNIAPEIPWLKYLNGVLADEIGEDENVVVRDPVFLKKLSELLENTEKRVVANYMFWNMVDLVKSDLSKEWRELDSDDEAEDEKRHKMCFRKVYYDLSVALHSYYIRNYFREDSKNSVMELIKYIHRELLRIIEGSDWMDDMTKKLAIEKANSMKTVIGYPQELMNDTAVMEVYKGLTISNNSYYRNLMNKRKWRIDDQFSSLRKQKTKSKWTQYAEAAEVNAFYNPEDNLIDFPAGILQGVFFDKDRPHYMNFGGIGYVIGHEITHGFDTEGKKYDKDGNIVDWWDKTTDELYHKRVKCIVEQYSNYTLESGIKINGELTQAENIADNGGMKEAYRAYHTWVRDNGPEPLLPGLKYTQNQLFWISAANVWCSKAKPEILERMVQFDSHSPAEFRVIGPMSNLKEFSRDFNCPPDSPMNKQDKCHVW